ncbi:hypothetical protein LP414_05650 [Polaromonas sp. P1(28)-13]|nr:hypothetical protein LP414_05650 [Polaromonas sp. P1(28)-13]
MAISEQTLTTLDQAYMRPRYPGYIEFQDHASRAVHECLLGKASARETIRRINGWQQEHAAGSESR